MKDTLPFMGIPYAAVVDENGIADGGTATIEQLAYRGMSAVAVVDSSGEHESGLTASELAARGIRSVCIVDEDGLADGVTVQGLAYRGLRAVCPVDEDGIADGGTATAQELHLRGIEFIGLLDEDGGKWGGGFSLIEVDGATTTAQWEPAAGKIYLNGDWLNQDDVMTDHGDGSFTLNTLPAGLENGVTAFVQYTRDGHTGAPSGSLWGQVANPTTLAGEITMITANDTTFDSMSVLFGGRQVNGLNLAATHRAYMADLRYPDRDAVWVASDQHT
jgi:hypothetical protein